ncbi:MAG: DUF6597 domain-containing transcriptional factor [Bacteroidales bacterium]
MNYSDTAIFTPDVPLNKYVDHITVNTFNSDSVIPQLVVPDGMTELVINFGSCYSRIDRIQKKEFSVKGSHLIGLKSTYCFVKPSSSMDVITIRFKIGALKNFTRIPQLLLVDKVIDANDIFGRDIERLESELFQIKDIEVRMRLINKFLLSKLHYQNETPFDKVNKEMLVNVVNSNLKINRLLEDKNYKTIERMFLKNMGITPKKSINILRFNFATYLCSQGNNLTQVAYKSGYYDQSHSIKSFMTYSGVTPKEYLKINDKLFKLNQERINAQFIYPGIYKD